jgi:hypothetical protein
MVIQPLLIKEKIMRLQRYLAIILAMFILTSCGYTITKTTTTTSVVVTTTTVNYGKDCNSTVDAELQELFDELSAAWGNATDGVPTRSEYTAKHAAIRALRSYVRNLDIPLLPNEQEVFTQVMQDYIDAYNKYWESGKRDLSVNDYLIPFGDAEDDFVFAWNSICSTRTKYTS